MSYAVAVDIGGTFTDLVAYDHAAQKVIYAKSPTTYENLVEGILDCFNKARIKAAEATFVNHGTTLVINSLIQRKGAKTALGHQQGLSRHSGNRPRQPARSVRSALSARRAADSARAASRSTRANRQQG